VKAVYGGLTIDVGNRVLYFCDEGQGQVGELDLNYTSTNYASGDDEVKKRIIVSRTDSRPRSVAVDTVNR